MSPHLPRCQLTFVLRKCASSNAIRKETRKKYGEAQNINVIAPTGAIKLLTHATILLPNDYSRACNWFYDTGERREKRNSRAQRNTPWKKSNFYFVKFKKFDNFHEIWIEWCWWHFSWKNFEFWESKKLKFHFFRGVYFYFIESKNFYNIDKIWIEEILNFENQKNQNFTSLREFCALLGCSTLPPLLYRLFCPRIYVKNARFSYPLFSLSIWIYLKNVGITKIFLDENTRR